MARQNTDRRPARRSLRLMGRPASAPRQTWHKTIVAEGLPDIPDGLLVDVTPAPGRTFTRETWPPRGRGRGESLWSPRRVEAKLRAVQVFHLRIEGHTWQEIADHLGFKDASGPYRAYRRTMDRLEWDDRRRAELKKRA